MLEKVAHGQGYIIDVGSGGSGDYCKGVVDAARRWDKFATLGRRGVSYMTSLLNLVVDNHIPRGRR